MLFLEVLLQILLLVGVPKNIKTLNQPNQLYPLLQLSTSPIQYGAISLI